MVKPKTLDKNLYVCYACGSRYSKPNKKGVANWFLNKPTRLVLCSRCYDPLIYQPKIYPRRQLPLFKEKHRYDNARRFRFRDRRIYAWLKPRTGYCSQCPNNLYDKTTQKTHLHHALGYFIIFPWFGCIELCASCHGQA